MEQAEKGKDLEGTEPLTSEEIQWIREFRQGWGDYKRESAESAARRLALRRKVGAFISGDLAECS